MITQEHPTTTPSQDDPPVPLEDEPVHAAVRDLVTSHGLPRPAWAGRGRGTAVLRAMGPFPLDDLLAWAGEMTREPQWWVLRFPGGCDVFAAGFVQGLAVTIAASTRGPLPDRPATDHVIALAHFERTGGQAPIGTPGAP